MHLNNIYQQLLDLLPASEEKKEVQSWFVGGRKRGQEAGTMVKFHKIDGTDEYHAAKCMGWYVNVIYQYEEKNGKKIKTWNGIHDCRAKHIYDMNTSSE